MIMMMMTTPMVVDFTKIRAKDGGLMMASELSQTSVSESLCYKLQGRVNQWEARLSSAGPERLVVRCRLHAPPGVRGTYLNADGQSSNAIRRGGGGGGGVGTDTKCRAVSSVCVQPHAVNPSRQEATDPSLHQPSNQATTLCWILCNAGALVMMGREELRQITCVFEPKVRGYGAL